MITIPIMLLVGMSPSVAIATNKLQGSSGTLMATVFFIKKKEINLKEMRLSILMTFLGSVLGGWLVLQIRAEYLIMILPFFTYYYWSLFSIISKYSKRRSTEKNKYVVVCVNSGSIPWIL